MHRQPQLRNTKLLLRYRKVGYATDLPHRLATALAATEGGLSIGTGLHALGLKQHDRFAIYALACAGVVELDLTRPLDDETLILTVCPGLAP